MSQFTDTQLPQFTPYTPQLPIEAMATVGAERQQMYNTGVQKIQAQIDNIAGLDIVKDVDKNYLQSKLNELGSKLTTVAAGDFSNFQLTNSVAGMTKQVIKDRNIQNAVQSTAHYRKQQSEIERAKREGKFSVQNEAFFQNQVSDYLQNPNIGEVFNGEYVPYTDVGKKLRDVAEKVHEIDNSIDIPYKRDANGQVILQNGKPIVDDAMLSIKTKGKPAEKILANFYDNLDENDQRQLKIDGWYHYRGATKNTFINDITHNYQQSKELLNSKILNLNLELETNTKLSQAQKSAIQAQINDAHSTLTSGSLEKQLQTSISQIDNIQDLDAYKYKLYTQKYLTNLAKDMSYESVQKEIKSNPYKQMEMEGRRLQAEYDKMRQAESHFQQNLAWDKTKFFVGEENKRKEKEGSVGPVSAERISTDVNTPTLDKLEGEINDIQGTKEKPGLIDQLNSDNFKNVPNTVTDKKQYLENLFTQYKQDPSFINKQTSPDIRKYLEQRRGLDILLRQKQNLANSTRGIGKELNDKLDKELGTEQGIGSLVSAKELLQVQNDWSNLTKSGDISEGDYSTDISKFLERYPENSRLYPVAKAFIKNLKGQPLSDTEKIIVKKSVDLGLKYSSKVDRTLSDIRKQQSEYLAKHMPERQTMAATLSEDNKVDMNAVKFAMGDALANMKAGGVDVTNKGDFDPEKVQNLMKEKNVTYRARKNYDGSGEIQIIHGNDIQTIPLANFGKYFPQYAQNSPLNEIKYSILSSPNKTTNWTGDRNGNDPVNAGLTGYNIPGIAATSLASLVRMDIIGHDKNDGSANDTYTAYLYVNDNGAWKKHLLTPSYVNDATLQTIMSQIGTQTIDDILKGIKK